MKYLGETKEDNMAGSQRGRGGPMECMVSLRTGSFILREMESFRQQSKVIKFMVLKDYSRCVGTGLQVRNGELGEVGWGKDDQG